MRHKTANNYFMKRLFIILFSAGFIFVSRGNAQDVEKQFTKISISQKGKIIISQGEECNVRLENNNTKTKARVEISDGTLFLHSNGENAVAYATVKKLEYAEITAQGRIEADDILHSDDLKLVLSGIGKMEMQVNAANIFVDISGKGDIEISGKAQRLNAVISGAGKIEAADLKTDDADISISGVGKAYVDARENLHVEISGVGSVKYVKEPAHITKSITGIGKTGRIYSDEENEKDEKGNDTTTVKVGNKQIIIIDEEGEENKNQFDIKTDKSEGVTTIRYHKGAKTEGHWGGFELGFNNYFQSGFDSGLPEGYDFLELNTGKSIAVNLNLFDWKAKIFNHHLMFVTGLGITWNNWRFQSDRTLISNAPQVSANFDSIDYKKNKLTASYVTLPLLLEFNTSAYEKKSFHVGAGIIGGYRIGSHTKQKFELNGKTRKVKTYDDFNLDPFRYDATLRIGYRGYTVFGTYGLNRLFKKNEGPELHPFTFGITLLDW